MLGPGIDRSGFPFFAFLAGPETIFLIPYLRLAFFLFLRGADTEAVNHPDVCYGFFSVITSMPNIGASKISKAKRERISSAPFASSSFHPGS